VCWTADDAFGFMYGTRPGAVGGCGLHFSEALVNKTGHEATWVGTKWKKKIHIFFCFAHLLSAFAFPCVLGSRPSPCRAVGRFCGCRRAPPGSAHTGLDRRRVAGTALVVRGAPLPQFLAQGTQLCRFTFPQPGRAFQSVIPCKDGRDPAPQSLALGIGSRSRRVSEPPRRLPIAGRMSNRVRRPIFWEGRNGRASAS